MVSWIRIYRWALHRNWGNDEFRTFVLNGIIWTAKGEVPENGISTPTPTEAELDAYL